ncbi:diguanylate cyclase (GGDEF)-like protein [Sphaerotilus hippei]|uniref:Diguanylate cyclase (GGDEF)-like protein n=1 Tax=Sphaerotilus hippei TaxID=744406 RepID=A0A318GXX0_9BURK|nr:GGDEF domain-containing protein [Sphaerotilus hippei]PXW94432.1 diguanylate cyclase (GGDEF)-like protein [Sphaerotilus hippei]
MPRCQDCSAAPTPRARATDGPAGVPCADWNALFEAIRDRLQAAVSGSDVAPPLRTCVSECLDAFGLLQAMLDQERARGHETEQALCGACTALSQARAELVGTQAGELQARHLALHDGLTSLPNRRYFSQRLDQALARHTRVAVLFVDLDDFKPINDLHGHEIGDELLRIIAHRLARSMRAGDMVGRLGGDEFACLLADEPDAEQLRQVACKLYDTVSAPLQLGDLQLVVHPSIGIASCPTDGTTSQALLHNADTAMYAAKRQRCGHAFFEHGTALPPPPPHTAAAATRRPNQPRG